METKINVSVEKAVLTPTAVKRLENLQDHNNSVINGLSDAIKDVIYHCIKKNSDEPDPELITLSRELIFVDETLKELKKP